MNKKQQSFFLEAIKDFIHSSPEPQDEKLREKRNLAIRVLEHMENIKAGDNVTIEEIVQCGPNNVAAVLPNLTISCGPNNVAAVLPNPIIPSDIH